MRDADSSLRNQTTIESLVSRIEPFIPNAQSTLQETVTGALAELSTWWTERSSDKVAISHLNTADMQGLSNGVETANTAIDSGANLIVLTSSLDHCSSQTRAIIGLLTRRDAFAVFFQDRGVSDQQAMKSIQQIRDLMHASRAIRGEAVQLAALDSTVEFTLGILLTASARKTPVITGNAEHLAAALIAQRLSMKASSWWRHGSTSADPAIVQALNRLDIPRGLALDLTDHTGLGARISAQILQEFILD